MAKSSGCRDCGFSRREDAGQICPACTSEVADDLAKYAGYRKTLFYGLDDVPADVPLSRAGMMELGSVYQVELHHNRLLRGDETSFKKGCRSVLYWGRDGPRSDGKFLGKIKEKAKSFADVRAWASARPPVEALKVVCGLPEFKFAFGTKLLSFLFPDRYPILDAKLAADLESYGPNWQFAWQIDERTGGRSLKPVKFNRDVYVRWMDFTLWYANQLNRQCLLAPRYCDKSGPEAWRPVDVERTIFAKLSAKAVMRP